MKKHVLLLLGLLALLVPLGVVSTAQASQDKTYICHRTASDTNPYVLIHVPTEEANGHITGTGKQHNQQVEWKSDGVWNGVPHQEGDVKLDYFATQADIDAGDCVNQTPEVPVCPDGTDLEGTPLPDGIDTEEEIAEFCNEEEEPPVCPDGTDLEGTPLPDGIDTEEEIAEFCNEESEQPTCPEDSELNPGQVIPDGETEETFCNIDTQGEQTCPADSEVNAGEEIPPGETQASYCNKDDKPKPPNPPTPGGEQETPPEVAGEQATAPQAPAAVPTSVDAGL